MRAPRFFHYGVFLTTFPGLVGCTASAPAAAPEPQPRDEAQVLAPQTKLAAIALAYEPAPAEAEIARAQGALRAQPESLEAHAALATAFIRRARATSRAVYSTYARDVLVAARSLDADDSGLRVLSTMLLLEEHKFEAAAQAAYELQALRPNDPTPRLLLGDARLELGEYDGAIEAYQAAVDLRPDLRSYNRGSFLRWMQGDFDGARKVMELALQSGSARDPESRAWCFSDYGAMYLHRGDTARAAAAADRALQLVPEYVPALVLKARALLRQGDTLLAESILARAVAARPNAEDFLRLAEVREETGDKVGAAEAEAQARKLAAHDPRPLAHYLARRGQAREEAVRLAKAELETRRNLWSHDTLALALWRAGRAHEAEQAIDKALAWNTPDANFRVHAGLIDADLGQPEAAREHLHAALAIDPGVDPALVAELRAKLGEA